MNAMKEAQFISQHMNELDNDMRAALEKGNKGTAKMLYREIKKLEKAQSRLGVLAAQK